LRELGLSSPIRAAILGVIIGRMAAPGSELAARRWLGRQSGLGELLDVDFERMPLMTLYRASDALMKYRDVIERTSFNRVHDLSNGVENFPLKSVEKFPVKLWGYCFQPPFFVA
jgi:hypothetical protein